MNIFTVTFFGHRHLSDRFAIEERLDSILRDLIDNKEYVEFLVGRNGDANDRYKENLEDLKADIELQEDLLKLGAMYMALEDAVEAGELDEMPRQSEFDNYTDYLPDEKSMSNEELEAYNNRLIDYMIDRSLDPKDPVFDDFKTSYEKLKTDLGHVADKLSRTDSTNPIIRYDTLCSIKYNFDSQSYYRFMQRATASALLTRGMMIIAAHEKIMTYPDEKTFIRLQKRVEAAATWLDESYETLGHPSDEIKAHPHFEEQTASPVYISDIVVLGMSLDSTRTDAANYLRENGYILADGDCITNSGYISGSTQYSGHNIYFGYKTTENYDEAIKDIILVQGTNADEHPTKSGYYLSNYLGDDAFLKMKGSLNEQDLDDYYHICLYYTKQDVSDNKAVYEWNGPRLNACSFNFGTYHKYCDFVMVPEKISKDVTEVTRDVYVENDPEYYPYSYVLGKKVAYYTTDGLSDLTEIGGALCNRSVDTPNTYGYFNWDDETLRTFQAQMTKSSIKDEFASAGMPDIPYGLVTEIQNTIKSMDAGDEDSRQNDYIWRVSEGKIIEPNSITPTEYVRDHSMWSGYDSNYLGEYLYYYNRKTGDSSKVESIVKHNFVALYLY